MPPPGRLTCCCVTATPSIGVIVAGDEGGVGTASTVSASEALAADTFPAGSICLAVSVWLPSDNVLLVMFQMPVPSATAVPSTVLPSVS